MLESALVSASPSGASLQSTADGTLFREMFGVQRHSGGCRFPLSGTVELERMSGLLEAKVTYGE